MKLFIRLIFISLIFLIIHEGRANTCITVTDSIIVKKNNNYRSSKVSIYPDAAQKILFFNVNGSSGKVYQLFVFDMSGNIVKQAEIRSKQTTFIKDIEKGNYLFEVFSNDDRIGEGQIAVM